MLNRLRERFGAKVVAIGVTTALLGGGVALAALPEPAEEALTEVAVRIGFEVPVGEEADIEETELEDTETEVVLVTDAETAQIDTLNGDEEHPMNNGEGVPEEVKTFFAELMVWVGCIQDGARAHGEQQSSADRIEDAEYDAAAKLELCGEKPINENDSEDELENELESEGEGRPAFLGEGEGRPAFLGDGEGRPDFAGGEGRP